MKVKDLQKLIENSQKYYPDFLEWDIALEQHPEWYNCPNCNKSEDRLIVPDCFGNGTDTLFIKSHAMGCCSYSSKRKIFGIQIHY